MNTAVTFHGLGESNNLAGRSPASTWTRLVHLAMPKRRHLPGDNQGGPGQWVDRTERLEPSSIDDFEVRIEVESIEPNTDDGSIDLVVEFAVH
jgi:hypothetical protein